MFCPSCGTKCPETAIACHSCGAVLPGLTETLAGLVEHDGVAQRGRSGASGSGAPRGAASGGQGAAGRGAARDNGPTGGATMVSNDDIRPASGSGAGGLGKGEVPTSPRVGQTKLVVEQGRILGEQFLLNDYEVIIGRYDAGTGRCPDIDLTAQDPAYVHRQHVRLAFNRTGDRLMVYDLGGRNGSYLNNQLLDKNASAVVQLGDKIRVGRVVLRVQAARERDDERPSR